MMWYVREKDEDKEIKVDGIDDSSIATPPYGKKKGGKKGD